MRRRLVSVAAAVLALATCGVAAGALKERAVDFSATGPDERTAMCKRGSEAVAGGFFYARTEDSAGRASDSDREGKRGWRYRLAKLSIGGDPLAATAYVYCDKSQPKLKRKSVTRALSAGVQPEAVIAKCTRGKEAVAGGFDVADADIDVVSSKRIAKREWEARFSGPPGTSVTAFALCDKREPGLKTKSATITINSSDFAASVSAKCRRRQELRSGGFESSYDRSGLDTDWALVDGSRRIGKRRWEVTGAGFQATPDLTAYAYCQRKPRKR